MSIRNRKETLTKFQTAISEFKHTLLSPLPRIKTDIVKLKCVEGHEFETQAQYLIGAYRKKSSSRGCGSCRDVAHNNKGRDNFYRRLTELGLEPLSPYLSARQKVKVKRIADGAINYICSQDLDAGRNWPKPPSKLKTFEEMVTELALKKPNYTLIKGDCNSGVIKRRVTVVCPQGHEYTVKWRTLLKFNCERCGESGTSALEKEFVEKFKEQYPQLTLESNKKGLKQGLQNRYEVDLFIREFNFAIEFCGTYFHANQSTNRHLEKRRVCEDKGWSLITLWEDIWELKPNAVLTRIQTVLENKRHDLDYTLVPWNLHLGYWVKNGIETPLPTDTLLKTQESDFLLVRDSYVIDWIGRLPRRLPQSLGFAQDLDWIPDSIVQEWGLLEGTIPLRIFGLGITTGTK